MQCPSSSDISFQVREEGHEKPTVCDVMNLVIHTGGVTNVKAFDEEVISSCKTRMNTPKCFHLLVVPFVPWQVICHPASGPGQDMCSTGNEGPRVRVHYVRLVRFHWTQTWLAVLHLRRENFAILQCVLNFSIFWCEGSTFC